MATISLDETTWSKSSFNIPYLQVLENFGCLICHSSLMFFSLPTHIRGTSVWNNLNLYVILEKRLLNFQSPRSSRNVAICWSLRIVHDYVCSRHEGSGNHAPIWKNWYRRRQSEKYTCQGKFILIILSIYKIVVVVRVADIGHGDWWGTIVQPRKTRLDQLVYCQVQSGFGWLVL